MAVANPNRPWRIIDERLLADRSPFARVYDQDLQLPNGQTVTNFVRVDLAPFAIVFAVLEDGRVPFVEQYRMGPDTYTLELPSGHIDKEEDAFAAAQRELREEAGVEAEKWRFLGRYIMDANRGCGWAHVFLAWQARQVAVPDHGDLGELHLHLLTLEEVRARWVEGEFISAPTSLAIGLVLNALH